MVVPDLVEALKLEFPEATEAECERFTRACQDGKKGEDQVKEEAEHLLENYLDWRSCYGLDYNHTQKKAEEDSNIENNENNEDSHGNDDDNDDAADWKYAIEKALEVDAQLRKAKELEKKLADDAKKSAKKSGSSIISKNDENETKTNVEPVNYDIEFSDSQKSEDDGGGKSGGEEGEKKNNGVKKVDDENNNNNNKETQQEQQQDNDGPDPKKLQQIVYLHKIDGKKITDKNGKTTLHVFPAMINRREANGEIYGLALCFYLDRKFDRSSTEKMTVLLDVRAGEGWPNPVAIMMVRFVRKIITTLQAHYPERLETLYVYPVPRPAMRIWHMCKRVLNYGITMDKIVMFAGPALRYSPLPKVELEEYVDSSTLDFLEEFRLDHFATVVESPDAVLTQDV